LENVKQYIFETNHGVAYEQKRITELEEKQWNITDYVKINILPCDPSETFKKQVKFDKIYVAASMAHRIPDCAKKLSERGELVIESAKYLLDLNQEQVLLYKEKVEEMALGAGLKRVGDFNGLSDYFIYQK
jgi:protein-L-isoaspartate O-methyltransferase